MASSPSGSVSSSAGGTVLTYSDTGTYGSVSSRILTIYDANAEIIQVITMGSSLTATFDNTVDRWLSFVCVVADNVGGSPWTATVNYLAEGIYTAAFLNRMVSSKCGCQPNLFCNLFKAELNLTAAERFSISGLGNAADATISAANTYINAQ